MSRRDYEAFAAMCRGLEPVRFPMTQAEVARMVAMGIADVLQEQPGGRRFDRERFLDAADPMGRAEEIAQELAALDLSASGDREIARELEARRRRVERVGG